ATRKVRTISAPAAVATAMWSGSLGRRARPSLIARSLQRGPHALEVLEGDAHRRALRAHLHAGRALLAAQAEVALAGHLHRLAVRALLVALDHHDVVPGAALRAVGAADARGLVDGDLERPHLAGDGAGGAVHHAHGVGALVTRGGHHPVAVLEPLSYEARLAAVRAGAPAHALVAARAGLEVDEQHTFAV